MSSIDAFYIPAARRRWSVWLILSIAVNLVLLGLILSWAFRFDGPPPHRPMRDLQRDLIPSLSAADAEIVTTTVQRLDEIQKRDDAVSVPRFARLQAALSANPYDRAATDTAFDQLEATRADHFREFRGIIADELSTLSPDGRAKLAAALSRDNPRPRPPQ
jgi:hypothetical protein